MNSFTDGSAFCPGAPKRVPSDSEKHRRVYTSSNVCHSHEWRVDTASGKTLKKRNACLHAVRQAVEKKIACIYGLRSEGVIFWLNKSNLAIYKVKRYCCHVLICKITNLLFFTFFSVDINSNQDNSAIQFNDQRFRC